MSDRPDYIDDNGDTFTYEDMEERFRDMLDEVYPEVGIGVLTWAPSHVFEEMDPIGFRCSVLDYVDGLVSDGELDEWEEGHRWLEKEDEEDEEEEDEEED